MLNQFSLDGIQDNIFKAEPSWKISEEFLPSETERAMQIDALSSARPISLEVRNSREIRETFDEISYAKGMYSSYSNNNKVIYSYQDYNE